jgi:hypothetical protein
VTDLPDSGCEPRTYCGLCRRFVPKDEICNCLVCFDCCRAQAAAMKAFERDRDSGTGQDDPFADAEREDGNV